MKARNLVASVTAALCAAVLNVLPASAAVAVVGGPYTGLKASGDTVRLQLSNFPTTAGMYVQQCLVVSAARPTSAQCNPASQVWISTAPGATYKPTDTIAVAVIGSFGAVNCLVESCGLFFRLDHTAPGNTSEDRYIPLTFVAATTAPLPADVITTKVKGVELAPNVVGTLVYRTPVQLEIATKSGAAASVKVYGEACTVSGTTVTALKGTGQCDIAVTSPGNSTSSAVTMHYPVNLVPAEQTLVLNLPKRIVGFKLLFTSKTVTNMGERPIVTIASGSACALKTTGINRILVAQAKGTCTVTIRALGREGLYKEFSQNYSFAVKKK